jgi:hypothetical protein
LAPLGGLHPLAEGSRRFAHPVIRKHVILDAGHRRASVPLGEQFLRLHESANQLL